MVLRIIVQGKVISSEQNHPEKNYEQNVLGKYLCREIISSEQNHPEKTLSGKSCPGKDSLWEKSSGEELSF